MAKKEKCPVNPRLGVVGGQAVVEGVMMKSGSNMAIASRMFDGSIKVTKSKLTSAKDRHKILGLPIIRGAVNFVEMMALSFKTMDTAAEALGLEEEEPTKFEKWLAEKLHISVTTFVTIVGGVLGVLLSVALFMFLPGAAGKGISALFEKISGGTFKLSDHRILFSLIEGLIKIGVFLLYLFLVSLYKETRRLFEYHGAEHKSVFCYEAGEELTPENVKKYSRFHPRCGTSFMFFMMIIGIIIGCFITTSIPILRTLIRLALLPVTVGIGFEVIKYAGKHDNFIIRAISAPGLWVQRITTKEPDEKQIECAIAALKSALPDVFPGYDPEAQFGPFEHKEKAKEKGNIKLIFAYARKIEKEQSAHRRVVLSQMTPKERARYRQREKR